MIFRAASPDGGDQGPPDAPQKDAARAFVGPHRGAFELDAEWSALAGAGEPLEGCELVVETDDLPGANDVDDLGYFARVTFE